MKTAIRMILHLIGITLALDVGASVTRIFNGHAADRFIWVFMLYGVVLAVRGIDSWFSFGQRGLLDTVIWHCVVSSFAAFFCSINEITIGPSSTKVRAYIGLVISVSLFFAGKAALRHLRRKGS